MFAPVAAKFALAARCAAALALKPDLRFGDAPALLLQPLPRVVDLASLTATEFEGALPPSAPSSFAISLPWPVACAGTKLHEADLLRAGSFVVGQMRALAAADSERNAQSAPGFVGAVPEADLIVQLDARLQLAGLRATLPAPVQRDAGTSGATARKVPSRGTGGVKSAAPRSVAQAAITLPPRIAPFPQLPDFDIVPQAAVWDVLMLWDMGNTFAPLLHLPPFSVERAAAAFWDCRARGSAPDEAAGASLHPGCRAAASTLFSDFCCGLFRVISGERTTAGLPSASLTAAHPEDVTASALEVTINRVAWPARVADYFGRSEDNEDADGSPTGSAFSDAATAALSAALESDTDCWAALEPAQRLVLATSLADAASASETFREYFNDAHEAAQAAQRLGRVPANPVRQSRGKLETPATAVEEKADAPPIDDATATRTWEEAAADRSLLRRGQPVGVDELGNRYYELGAAAGANSLFVARSSSASADPAASAGIAHLDFGLPPRWSVVSSGSRAASEIAAWLLPRRCAGEHAPKAFSERLASCGETGADSAPCFPLPAPVADGYAALEAASALPSGLPGVRRAVAALCRRIHFWQLPASELSGFASDLRKFSELAPESAAHADSLDIVAALAASVCTRLTASRTLPPAFWDGSARGAWQGLLAEAVTASQLGAALTSLHAALEAADSAAAHGSAPVVLNRAGFSLVAAQHDPTLGVPAVGDDVVVLRAGLLRAWRCLSKSWDVAPPSGLAPVTRATVLAASYRRAASGSSYGKRAAAWLLLDSGDGAAPFVAPLLLAEGAPEFVLPYKLVADARSSPWQRGDAVKILVVDDDVSTRHVPAVVVKLLDNSGDPWESVRIRCRPDAAGGSHLSAWVSPWELTRDIDAGARLDAEGVRLLELPTSDEDD